MSGGNQTVDRQLGELAAEMRALRNDQERHTENTEAMRGTLVQIQVQLGELRAERRTAKWLTGTIMTLAAAVAGALGGHLAVPPGTH